VTEKVEALEKIDAEGLEALREKVKEKPEAAQRTLKAHTICEGAMVNHTYIRDLDPMVVDEPPNLLGTDTAPNPSEAALAALGSCISVGLMSNATAQGITLNEISIELEGDIDTAAVWGTGNTGEGVSAGFTAVRVKTTLKGDASPEVLAEIEKTAVKWSPVVNTFTNPVEFSTELVTE
jgi:uncharacterized OsmC-like protein